jgi:hypothetical protein
MNNPRGSSVTETKTNDIFDRNNERDGVTRGKEIRVDNYTQLATKRKNMNTIGDGYPRDSRGTK